MRAWKSLLVVSVVVGASADVNAGGKLFHRNNAAESRPMVTPNGSVVPAWAARRIENSPVPLYAPYSGRRPWANALSLANTPSANWARSSQLGFGAGPVPGYTNGPLLGNYPQAAVGPNDGVVSPRQSTFWPFPLWLGGSY